jgi:hypothetical protein
VHWRSAESLLERAAHAPDERAAVRLGERARHHFRRSIALAPDQVASYAGLGRAHLVVPALTDPEEGLEWLRAAHGRLPGDRSIALWLAELELQLGQLEPARQRLALLPIRPHGDPASRAERDELRQAREVAGLEDVTPRSRRIMESRLDVDTPELETRVTELAPWVEVAGRAGLWEATLHDVVIAIDRSASTLLPTGIDLDGDGGVGETQRKGTLWNASDRSSDPDDAVIRAEVEAARGLIRQLDSRTVRVAVVTFADEATVLAPLGTPEAALEALDAEVAIDSPDTSLVRALSTSLEVLADGRDVNARRQRTLLLLSDGLPTLPTAQEGRRDAIELAEDLGAFGVSIHAFALGESAVASSDFYRELANRSLGRFVPVERPAEVVSELADARFTGLDGVSVFNHTSEAPARAVRVFPDGTFDAYAPLEEGENELEITVYVGDLPPLKAKRSVFFARPSRVGEKQRQAARALLLQIEYRTAELELLDEIRRTRQRRELDAEHGVGGGG